MLLRASVEVVLLPGAGSSLCKDLRRRIRRKKKKKKAQHDQREKVEPENYDRYVRQDGDWRVVWRYGARLRHVMQRLIRTTISASSSPAWQLASCTSDGNSHLNVIWHKSNLCPERIYAINLRNAHASV
jgi:hypothetical protein